MEVLLCLVDRAGEVVTRAEIEDRVWPDAVIGQDTLNRAISKLRRLLDDDAGQPHAIETIPKLGYRLMLPVTSAAAHPSSGNPRSRRMTAVGIAAAAPRRTAGSYR